LFSKVRGGAELLVIRILQIKIVDIKMAGRAISKKERIGVRFQ